MFKRFLSSLFFVISLAWVVQAAPSLTVGNTSGQAGIAVSFPVTFDPTTDSVAALQFDLTLPAPLVPGVVTSGTLLNSADKYVLTNVMSNTWRFLVYGLNQTAIAGGIPLIVQVTIAQGTPAGPLNVLISNVVYSDPNGLGITPGTTSGGVVTVTGNPLPMPQVTFPVYMPLNGSLAINNYSAYSGASFQWAFQQGGSSTDNPYSIAHVAGNSLNTPYQTNAATLQPSNIGLSLGTYQVTVFAVDASGNQSPSATGQVTLVNTDFSAMRLYPNPWRSDKHASYPQITFDQLPLGSTVKIFTVSGHLVKTITANIATATWDLTNDSGDKVASGIYIYLITDSQGDKTRGKVAVIK